MDTRELKEKLLEAVCILQNTQNQCDQKEIFKAMMLVNDVIMSLEGGSS